jgi:hypothetical protein
MHTHLYNERKTTVLVSLSEGTTEGGKSEENVREWKILKQPIYTWI